MRRKENKMFCEKFLRTKELYRTASLLALITIGYNMLEGIISVLMGGDGRNPFPVRFRTRFVR
jgi:hypothetical protein